MFLNRPLQNIIFLAYTHILKIDKNLYICEKRREKIEVAILLTSKRDVCKGREVVERVGSFLLLLLLLPMGRLAKVGGLTTCQVLEVPRGRGEPGGEGRGGRNCDLVDCCSSTMAGVSRVVVARGTIIRPAKNLVTIEETRSSTKFQCSLAPSPIN